MLQLLDEHDYLRSWVLEDSVARGLAYGVEIGGRISGISIIYPIAGGAWLMGARVAEDLRGRGVGSFLTRSLVEQASMMGMSWAALMTSWRNAPVHRIASKVGMEKILEVVNLVPKPGVLGKLALPGPSEPERLGSPGSERAGDIARRLSNAFPMIPAALGTLVWAPAAQAILEILRTSYVCASRRGGYLALAAPKCSWDLDEGCRSLVAAVVAGRGGAGDALESLGCLSVLAEDQSGGELSLWLRAGDPLEGLLEPLSTFSWRAFIYFKRLGRP